MALPSLGIEAFLAVAQLSNFTRAARLLHITQSALSQRIRQLETELGCALFIRDRVGARLTEPGELLLRSARAQRAIEEEVLARIRGSSDASPGGLAGTVRIGGFSSVLRSVLLPALAPLLRANPALNLTASTRELRDLPGLLKRGEIDYAVLDRDLEHEGIQSIGLGVERNVLVQAKGYDGPDDLFLDHDEQDETTLRYFKLHKTGPKKFRRRYVDDVYGLLDAARLGLGRAVLPMHLVTPPLEILHPRTQLETPVILHFYGQPFYPRLHDALLRALQLAPLK
jgi:DNA-binding transcriptional LysR family regulator